MVLISKRGDVLRLLIPLSLLIAMTQSTAPAPKTIETFGEEVIEQEHKSIESQNIVPTSYDNEQEKQESVQLTDKNVYETFEVTAYTAGYESTGKHPGDPLYGVTASGAYVEENHTIACPPSMEFGTRIYIPYFDNEFECQDRGGAIIEGHLDVYIPEVEDALQFGRRDLDVIVIPTNEHTFTVSEFLWR
jgi:3D (Asp-Asp-Asp) domain-containing protein